MFVLQMMACKEDKDPVVPPQGTSELVCSVGSVLHRQGVI